VTNSTIELTGDIHEYFAEIVDEVIGTRRVESSPAVKHYLVELLADYAKPGSTHDAPIDEPLTFLLRDALDESGAERFESLRRIGDGVLYLLGFFGGSFEGRGADRGYVLSVGSSAYGHASQMLCGSGGGQAPDVLRELATKFERFVAVIGEVADGMVPGTKLSDGARLKTYERWLVTGSERLETRLAGWGMVPGCGLEGVN
jgi:hypothetical protein